MNISVKSGTVRYAAAALFDDLYAPGQKKQNIVCTMDDGTEEKLWFQAYRMPHSQLAVGDRVQIIFEIGQDGKQRRRLVSDQHYPVPVAASTPSRQQRQRLPFEQTKTQPKQSAKDFIADRIAIFQEVLFEVDKADFCFELSPEDMTDLATSIIITGERLGINFKELIVKAPTQQPPKQPKAQVTTPEIKDYPNQASFEVEPEEIPY